MVSSAQVVTRPEGDTDRGVPRPPSQEPRAVEGSAARFSPGRALATLFAAVFYALGWVVALVVVPVALGVRWAAAAVVTGWLDCRDLYIGGGEG